MSDLVFNHSQHDALLSTCENCLAPTHSSSAKPPGSRVSDADLAILPEQPLSTPLALCFFSHHRPHLVADDLAFLHTARQRGWTVWKVWEDREAGPAFPEDDGRKDREGKEWDRGIRGTVWGWAMRWDGPPTPAADAS